MLVAFGVLGLIDRDVFTLAIGPRQPWYTQYTTPFWLVCMQFITFPGVLLFSARDILGRGLANALGLLLSIAWVIGLTWGLWRQGTKWFVPAETDERKQISAP